MEKFAISLPCPYVNSGESLPQNYLHTLLSHSSSQSDTPDKDQEERMIKRKERIVTFSPFSLGLREVKRWGDENDVSGNHKLAVS